MAKAKKKTAKKSTKKPAKKRASKKTSTTKRRAPKKGASHHIERAHTSLMRSLSSVKKSDLEGLKRIERAVEHALENARSSKE